MSKSLIDLISILDLEPIEVNLFRGRSPKTGWQRVFGGQVIGQAMVAACRTGGGPAAAFAALLFHPAGRSADSDHLRGRTAARRQELFDPPRHRDPAWQRDLPIMVSFHVEEEGAFDHQDKMPDVPPPEKLTAEEVAKQPMFKEMPDFIKRYYESDRPIELRRSNSAAISARRSTTAASMSGSAPPRSCRTIRRCTCARWPMPRTSRCSMRRWRATAARCSTAA